MALEREEQLKGISQALVTSKKLSKDEIQKYLAEANLASISIAKYLIDKNIISGLEIAMLVSKDFGVPMIRRRNVHDIDVVAINDLAIIGNCIRSVASPFFNK